MSWQKLSTDVLAISSDAWYLKTHVLNIRSDVLYITTKCRVIIRVMQGLCAGQSKATYPIQISKPHIPFISHPLHKPILATLSKPYILVAVWACRVLNARFSALFGWRSTPKVALSANYSDWVCEVIYHPHIFYKIKLHIMYTTKHHHPHIF